MYGVPRPPYAEVELIEVIRTRLLLKGKGVEGDPMRRVVQYWTKNGELLAEVDQWKMENTNAL